MNKEVLKTIAPLIGKKCCRVRIGDTRSLSLGFGKKIYHNSPKLSDTYYGEWEIGTYYCAWRIIKDNNILYGKNDPEDDYDVFTQQLKKLHFGSLTSIDQLNNYDIRFSFSSGIVIEFIATIGFDDEYFHIFGPEDIYIGLLPGGKWEISKANEPSLRKRKKGWLSRRSS